MPLPDSMRRRPRGARLEDFHVAEAPAGVPGLAVEFGSRAASTTGSSRRGCRRRAVNYLRGAKCLRPGQTSEGPQEPRLRFHRRSVVLPELTGPMAETRRTMALLRRGRLRNREGCAGPMAPRNAAFRVGRRVRISFAPGRVRKLSVPA
jgi:hypothetical protein